VYTVESVIAALESNKELSCEGIDILGCPSPLPHEGCNSKPLNCELCLNQKCKQPISVHRDYKKLTVLTFRYIISVKNQSGFIHKDDSSLLRLVKHGFIEKSRLKMPI